MATSSNSPKPTSSVSPTQALRARRREAGLCIECEKPPEPGRLRCREHLDANKKSAEKYHKTDKSKTRRKANADHTRELNRARDRVKYRQHGRRRFNRVKNLAKSKGKQWTLTFEEYVALLAKPCTYCGLPSDVQTGRSLDRIDNNVDYHNFNVLPCCHLCNMVRANRFTVDQMKFIGLGIREIRLARDEAITRRIQSGAQSGECPPEATTAGFGRAPRTDIES